MFLIVPYITVAKKGIVLKKILLIFEGSYCVKQKLIIKHTRIERNYGRNSLLFEVMIVNISVQLYTFIRT